MRMSFPAVKRFLSGYYIANALLLCSYALIRQYFFNHPHPPYTKLHNHAELDQWERQTAGLLIVAVIVKYSRSLSLEAFVSTFFLYGKAAMAVLVFMIDLRIFAYYVILNLLIFVTCPQPEYQGPAHQGQQDNRNHVAGHMTSLRSLTYTAEITVEFYAAWSPTSVHLEPVFAEISLRYKTESLRFAKLDLSRWPGIAKEYRIDMSGASPQIPSFVMFDKGEEIGRIPHIYPDGSVAKGKYRKGDIIKAFELDMRYATSMHLSGRKQTKKEQ